MDLSKLTGIQLPPLSISLSDKSLHTKGSTPTTPSPYVINIPSRGAGHDPAQALPRPGPLRPNAFSFPSAPSNDSVASMASIPCAFPTTYAPSASVHRPPSSDLPRPTSLKRRAISPVPSMTTMAGIASTGSGPHTPRTPNGRPVSSLLPRPEPPAVDMACYNRAGNTAAVPLSSQALWTAIDNGMASARYLRCTTTTLPATRDLSTQLGLPLAILCTPFAACDQEDLPTISSEPMRCAKCKGFLNPQALLSEGKWVCNFCGMSNVLPESYSKQSIELQRGSVDYLVGSTYCTRPPLQRVVILAIACDCQAFALIQALLACNALSGCLLGVMLYTNKHMHFVTPDAVHVVDIEDSFLPIPVEKWLIASEAFGSQKAFAYLKTFDYPSDEDSITVASTSSVVQLMVKAVKHRGGQLYLITSTSGSEDVTHYGTDEEVLLYGSGRENGRDGRTSRRDSGRKWDPPLTRLPSFADLTAASTPDEVQSCSGAGLCVTAILIDPASGVPVTPSVVLGDLCHGTGGHLWSTSLDSLHSTMFQALTSQSAGGSDVILKLRTSCGVRATKIHGPGRYFAEDVEQEVALMDAHSSVVIELSIDPNVSLKEPISIQLATLYTTNGVRKVRIHTLSLAVSSRPSSILKAADVEAITVVIAKQAAQTGMKLGLAVRNGPREGIMHAMERILVGYRSTLSDAAIGPNQLALPDTLKTLPLHILGLLKHPAFLENPREVILVPAHVRVQALWGLLSGTVEQIVQEVLPRLVNVFAVMDELMGGTGSISGMKEDWDVGLSISRPTSLTLSNPINPHSTPSRTMTPHTTPPQAPQTAPAVPPLSSPMPPPLPMHTSASSTATTTPMQSPATSFYCSPVLPSPHMRISRLLRQYALPCSAEVLQPDQMHLLDDGIYLWLLVGRQVNHDVVEDIFSGPQYDCIRKDTDHGCLLHSILATCRPQTVHVVRTERADVLTSRFATRLVEDGNSGALSYGDFLSLLQVRIQEKLK